MSETFSRSFFLPDEAATVAFGTTLGQHLRAGQGLGLIGDLGAGKTCLTRGLGVGLGLDDPEAVCSPTYLLVVEHPGATCMVHIDAYLPAKTRAFLEDGGFDYLEELHGVVVVEWADRIEEMLPEHTLWAAIRPARGGREIVLEDRTGHFSWIADLAGDPA